MDHGVMNGAALNGARVCIEWVDVVSMNDSPAGAGGVPEQLMDDAACARKLAPPLAVVNSLFHRASLARNDYRTVRMPCA